MSRPSSVGLSKSAPDLTGVRSHSGHGKRKKKDVLQTSRDFSKDEIKRGPPLPDSAKDSGLSPLNDLLFDPSKLLGEQRAKVLEQSKMPGAGAAWLPTESLPPVRNAAARRRAVAAGSNQTARDLKEENERARSEMADGVRALAETLSQLKFVADKKQRELSKLRDDIRNLKISAREDDSSPLPGVAPALFERLESLKKELNAVEDKIRLETNYQRTLKHMHMRLRTAKESYDAQIDWQESRLNRTAAELERALAIYNQIIQAKKESDLQLRLTKGDLEEKREDWNEQLRMLKSKLQESSNLEQARNERARNRADITKRVQGDLNEEQEKNLERTAEELDAEIAAADQALKDVKAENLSLEAAFNRIRGCTGVTDPDEIIMKFNKRNETKEYLQKTVNEIKDRISLAQSSHKTLLQELEKYKYGGVRDEGLREKIEAAEKDNYSATRDLHRVRSQCHNMESVLFTIKNAITTLTKRLEFVYFTPDGEDVTLEPPAPADSGKDTGTRRRRRRAEEEKKKIEDEAKEKKKIEEEARKRAKAEEQRRETARRASQAGKPPEPEVPTFVEGEEELLTLEKKLSLMLRMVNARETVMEGETDALGESGERSPVQVSLKDDQGEMVSAVMMQSVMSNPNNIRVSRQRPNSASQKRPRNRRKHAEDRPVKDAPKKSAGKAKGGKAKGREEDMIWAKASDGELTAADVAHIRDVFTRTREEGLEAVGGSNSLAALDEPKQGYIKGSSLHRVILEVGHRCTQREEAALLDKLVSSNGHVSFERFMEWWTKTVRQQSTVLDRDEMKAISMKRFQSSEKKRALQRKREQRGFWEDDEPAARTGRRARA